MARLTRSAAAREPDAQPDEVGRQEPQVWVPFGIAHRRLRTTGVRHETAGSNPAMPSWSSAQAADTTPAVEGENSTGSYRRDRMATGNRRSAGHRLKISPTNSNPRRTPPAAGEAGSGSPRPTLPASLIFPVAHALMMARVGGQ